MGGEPANVQNLLFWNLNTICIAACGALAQQRRLGLLTVRSASYTGTPLWLSDWPEGTVERSARHHSFRCRRIWGEGNMTYNATGPLFRCGWRAFQSGSGDDVDSHDHTYPGLAIVRRTSVINNEHKGGEP